MLKILDKIATNKISRKANFSKQIVKQKVKAIFKRIKSLNLINFKSKISTKNRLIKKIIPLKFSNNLNQVKKI